MSTLTLIPDRDGERLDAFLARCGGLTRSAAQKLLEEGRVTCGEKLLKKNDKTAVGQELCVDIPEAVAVDIVPQNIPLDVVYEDEHILLVNKPSFTPYLLQ